MGLITLYRRVSGVLTDATTVTLADPGGNFGILRLDTLASVVASGTATTHPSTGVYQYDISALDPRYSYVASWKVVASYGTDYLTEAIAPAVGLSRQSLRQEAAKAMGLFMTSGTATGGSTVTLVDTTTTDSGVTQSSLDAAERWKGGYLLMTGGLNAGLWREISDDQPSTGTLTVAKAFPNAVVSGDTYEVYAGLNPDQWGGAIDTGLTRCLYLTRSPLTLIPDGDMEANGLTLNGVTTWTGLNATLVKSFTDGVTFGAQSLLVINSTANGYAQSAAIPVRPNSGFQLWVDYRCIGTAVSTAQVQVWDNTNGAAIQAWQSPDADSGQNPQGGLIHLGFSVPANCFSILIQLGGKESTAAIAFDDAVLLCTSQFRYSLPSWLVTRNQYASLQERWGVRPLDYRYTDVTWPLNIEEDPTAVVTFRCDLPPNQVSRPVYLSGERPYGPMASTADSATTACPPDWAKWKAAEAAYELYGKAIEQQSVARLRVDRTDIATRAAWADSQYLPKHDTPLGFSRPWIGTRISVLP